MTQRDTGPDFEPMLSLGSGGMGTAWLCRSIGAGTFERLVVVKRLHAHIADRHDALLRFMDEANLTASLHHANVIGTYQVGQDERGPFIVLEYIEGASLDQLVERALERGETVSVAIALRVMLDSLSGLQAVHTAQDHSGQPLNILHRDISLQNLLVGVDGVCRVADFGAAKSDVRKYSTDQRYLLGKLVYLPPEYLRREKVGPTLDVYSVGITLWQTLSGNKLWEDDSEAQVVTNIIEGGIPKLSEHVQVPPQLDALLAKATHLDPAERFQSAEQMAQEIEALGRESGWVATHSEVARWVKELMAGDLEKRRQCIAIAREEAEQRMRQASTAAPRAFEPEPALKSRLGWLLAASALGLGAVLGAVVAATSDATPPVGSATPDSRRFEVSVPDSPTSPMVSPAPANVILPGAPPSASQGEKQALPPTKPGQQQPAKLPLKASGPTSQSQATKAIASSRSVSAPDTVTTKNPYR